MKRALPYFAAVIAILVIYVVIVRAQDTESVRQLERAFNQQQAAQIGLSARSIEDHFQSRVNEIISFFSPYHQFDTFQDTFSQLAPLYLDAFQTEYIAFAFYPVNGRSSTYIQNSYPSDFQARLKAWLSEYAPRAKLTDEVVVTPFVASPEAQYYGIVKPVYRDGALAGFLVVAVNFQATLDRYIVPLRSGQFGAAWIQDHRGVVIYDHERHIIGQNVADLHAGYAQVEALDRTFLFDSAGMSEYDFTVERGGEVRRKLVAWDTAHLGNQQLTVAISAPDTEIIASLSGSRLTNLVMSLGFSLVLVISGIMIYRFQQGDLRRLVRARTQELAAEREMLRISEARYRALFEQANDAIVLVNEDRNILDANSAVTDLLGYSRSELLEMKIQQLQPSEYHNRPLHKETHFETEVSHKDGTRIPVDITAGYVVDDFRGQRLSLWFMRDITQRKHDERELHRVQQLFTRGPMVAFRGRLRGNSQVQYVSPNIAQFGYSPEQFHSGGLTFWDIVHPDDRVTARGEASNLIKAGINYFEQEYRILSGDGRVIWVRDLTIIIDDEQGTPTYVASYLSDINERKQAEIALRESEERYRALYEHTSDGIYLVDTESKFIAVNQRGADMLGTQPEDMIGRSFVEYLAPDETGEGQERYQTLLRGEALPIYERTFRRVDGEYILAEINAAVVYDAEGNISHLQSTVRDITERKRNEQALRESEERFRQLAENVHEVFFVYDVRQHTLLYINPVFEQIWQRDTAWILKRPMRVMRTVYPEDRALLRPLMRKLPTNAFGAEFRILHPDGQLRWVRINVVPLIQEDKIYRIVGTAEDVTARKDSEQKVIALRVERERIRILANFIKAVTHEFKTPLSIINTRLYLLQKHAGLEEDNRYLSEIKQQSEVILKLIDALVTLSRLDTNLHLAYSSVNLNTVVKQVPASLLREQTTKNLNLNFDLDPGLPNIQADVHDLYQAYIGILENAVKYTPDGGQITVRTFQRAQYAVVEVKDTGIGIEETQLQSIFDRFYRIDAEHSTAGLGLGLSIAQMIVNRHQGVIEAESAIGQGSTFTMMLPVDPALEMETLS